MSLTLCDTLTLMGLKFKELLEDAAGGHKMIHYIKGLLGDESHRKVKKAHKERLLTDCLSCAQIVVDPFGSIRACVVVLRSPPPQLTLIILDCC